MEIKSGKRTEPSHYDVVQGKYITHEYYQDLALESYKNGTMKADVPTKCDVCLFKNLVCKNTNGKCEAGVKFIIDEQNHMEKVYKYIEENK